jgi:putative tricarboxylic transport membrane protein
MRHIPPRSTAGLCIGIGLVVLGCVIGFDAATMRVPPSYSKVGPQVFPAIVSIGLVVTGLATALRSVLAGMTRPVVVDSADTDWRALGIVAAGLVLHALLLKTLGFVIMALVLFMIVAVALGSRHYLRDATIGVVMALVTYFGFTRGLGLQLPSGIFAGVF